MRLRELIAGVESWAWPSPRFGYDFNGTYFPDARIVVDPVDPSNEELARLVAGGVDRIVLTNRNHFRAAAQLRAATGARVAVHPADAPFVRGQGVVVDDDLALGQELGPFVVVGAAGKSPGEIALHWPARQLLLIGDACVGNPPGALGLLPDAVIDDRAMLEASLRALLALDFDILLVGDGVPILTGGRAALAALVASFREPRP